MAGTMRLASTLEVSSTPMATARPISWSSWMPVRMSEAKVPARMRPADETAGDAVDDGRAGRLPRRLARR